MEKQANLNKIHLNLDSLSQTVKDYLEFSGSFFKNPSSLVKTHFNPLFNSFNKRLNLKQATSKTEIKESLLEEWILFLNQVDASNAQFKKIIRLGLSSIGLEYNQEFQKLIARQSPQIILYKWLYTYVVKFQILNPEFDHEERFWLDLLLYWTADLKKNPDFQLKIRNMSLREAVIEEFKTFTIIDGKKYSEYIESKVQFILNELYEDKFETLDISSRLISILNQEFQINFYSSDFFYQNCLISLFEKSLHDYLSNRGSLRKLDDILSIFCLFNHKEGLDRFIVLFQNIFSEINSSEKELIKNFLKNQLGDPRVSKQNWQSFKDKDETVYKKILFWFNEADFELFFEYVFSGQPDEHGRQECWKRYLPYADDIRIFLPNKSRIEDFKNLAKENNRESILEPIENWSRQTSFIIKIDKVMIFETVETGNASYVYDLSSADFNNPKNYSSQKAVLGFYDLIFNTDNYRQQAISTTEGLAFTDLAPNGSGVSSFFTNRHWRFTHDRNYKWHDSVRNMMKQVHRLSPYKEIQND